VVQNYPISVLLRLGNKYLTLAGGTVSNCDRLCC